MIARVLWAVVLAGSSIAAAAQPLKFDGTICRMNRAADRMIIESEAGPRLRITADDASVTFEGIHYDRLDLRTGERVRVSGNRNGSQIRATVIDARVRIPDIGSGSLFPSHTVTGRFAVREAQTEFFSLHLPGKHYVRVDAKSAYGANGRVWVSSLKPGDLLEIRGDWQKDGLLKASSINVITDKENTSCRADARRDESREDTAAREADEERFLQGSD